MTKPRAAIDRLLVACWTSAGDVRPIGATDRSPLPIERRLAAAAAAGFTGFGLNHADLVAVRDAIGYPALRTMLDAAGIAELQVELVDYWWAAGPRRVASDAVRADLLDAARCLPVGSIKIASGNEGGDADPAVMAPELCVLAEEAAQAGTIVVLEPCAFAALSDLEAAVSLVRRADHPAAGILLDVWHLLRAGFPLARLRDTVPPGLLRGVELDDAMAVQVGTGLEDTFDRRILCGQGEADTVGFIRELRSLGWDGPGASSTCPSATGACRWRRPYGRLRTPPGPASCSRSPTPRQRQHGGLRTSSLAYGRSTSPSSRR